MIPDSGRESAWSGRRGLYRRAGKRLFDIGASAVALILLAPIFLGLALAIALKLGRPVLFRQTRPGLHGLMFELVKFRSMTDARDALGRLLPDEERIPPFGAWLRSTSLDELPELLLVLRGKMSLVGPRPLMVEYIPRYSPRQARRHEVKPGITGLAQIRGRNSLSWEERFEHDVEYVERHSLMLDFWILWKTVSLVVRREGISHPRYATMPEFIGHSPKTRIMVLGAGGHGRVIGDAVLCTEKSGGELQLVGFLDDDVQLHGQTCLGRPVYGPIASTMFGAGGCDCVIIGFGSNQLRMTVFHWLVKSGVQVRAVIHPSAVIADDVPIGMGTFIAAGVVVNTGASIGCNVILNTSCSVDHDCLIKNHVHLCPGVHLGGGANIEEGVFAGVGCCVLPQLRIRPWTILGAGSVQIVDSEGYETRVGVPALRIRSRIRDLLDQPAELERVLGRLPHDFYHLPGYLKLCAREEEVRSLALHITLGETELFVPLLLRLVPTTLTENRLWDAYSPYGYPGPLVYAVFESQVNELMKALKHYCYQNNIVSLFLRNHPLLGCFSETASAMGEIFKHGNTVMINLRQDLATFEQGMRNSHKRAIRKLQKAGFEVRINHWEDYTVFQKLYAQTMTRVNAARYYFFSGAYFDDFRRVLSPNVALISVLNPAGKVVAGGLFVRTGGIVQYHLGGTTDDHLNWAPSKLMFYKAFEYYAESGAEWLNLGGGLGGRDDELFQFKLGFSQVIYPYSTQRIVVDGAAYETLCERNQIVHGIDDVPESFFPKYRYNVKR